MFCALIILFFVTYPGSASSQSHLGDECRLNTIQSETVTIMNKEALDLEIPTTCLEGDVMWDYPRGYLHFFTEGYNFTYSICIGEARSTSLGGITAIKQKIESKMALPTENEPACTPEVTGKMELMIQADDNLLYFTDFMYRVVSSQMDNV